MITSRNKNNHQHSHPAFTIVELLIVIVVIGILAAITIVAYNGIQTRARVGSLHSDLAGAAKQLGAHNATEGSYPANANSLQKSDTTEFTYTYTQADNSYCIAASHSTANVGTFHRINGGLIQEGPCPGNQIYTVGGAGPAGGVVFYDKGNSNDGWRYLEAINNPIGGSWGEPYGCAGISIAGANNPAIGAGTTNTAAILAACSDPSSAAAIANNYSQNGYSDWFLPSGYEIDTLMARYLDNSIQGELFEYACSTINTGTSTLCYVLPSDPCCHMSGTGSRTNSVVRIIPVRRF